MTPEIPSHQKGIVPEINLENDAEPSVNVCEAKFVEPTAGKKWMDHITKNPSSEAVKALGIISIAEEGQDLSEQIRIIEEAGLEVPSSIVKENVTSTLRFGEEEGF